MSAFCLYFCGGPAITVAAWNQLKQLSEKLPAGAKQVFGGGEHRRGAED